MDIDAKFERPFAINRYQILPSSMASDFFYPNTGGVEAHIIQLSQCLIDLGHTVVVITHAYGSHVGPQEIQTQQMRNRLKVYYLPIALYDKHNIIWPFVFNTFAPVRQVLIREQIDIVHGHSAFSPMAHEVIFHAKTLGINTVFTDHSLFGFNDIGSIIHSRVVKQSLLQCNHIVCVSNYGAKNQALELKINDQEKVPISVIPNAVDTDIFTPNPTTKDPNKITIIVNSRLVYRKGIDLLASVLPKICSLDPKVHFIIAGDGPKRYLIENAVKQNQLQDKVEFLGSVPHDRVKHILVRGDIFLNTSLIEAFCIAIVEAASCGLQVVSTNVGGLPEVLPQKLIKLTEPTVEGLLNGVKSALDDLTNNRQVSPLESHKIIQQSYSWQDVASKTVKVYDNVSKEPKLTLKDRLYRYQRSHSLCAYLFLSLTLINHILMLFYDWYNPREEIDTCRSRKTIQKQLQVKEGGNGFTNNLNRPDEQVISRSAIGNTYDRCRP